MNGRLLIVLGVASAIVWGLAVVGLATVLGAYRC